MDQTKFIELQKQMKDNNAELMDYLKDLDSWAVETKKKESNLKTKEPSESNSNKSLPPVRNSLLKKKKKKKSKTPDEQNQNPVTSNGNGTAKKTRISAYDYRAWDRFDVDKAVEESDEGEVDEKKSSEGESTDEEWEDERRKRLAEQEKERGNLSFKEGKYEEAVEHYTTGIRMEPASSILYSNRAMALLKLGRYAACEQDCDFAIRLNPDFTKAYFRRGTARKNLDKLEEALSDFQRILQLEPHNKPAEIEANALESQLNPSGIVQAIQKPPHKRSKAPLRRLVIEEVGGPSAPSTARIQEVPKASGDSTSSAPLIDEVASSTSTQNPKPLNNTPHSSHKVANSVPKPSSRPSDSPVPCPPPPTSSIQLKTQLRELKRHCPAHIVPYLCSIRSDVYVSLFRDNLESDVLSALLQSLREGHTTRLVTSDQVIESLMMLTKVSRFDVTWMFLSARERACITELIPQLSAELPGCTRLETVKKKYS